MDLVQVSTLPVGLVSVWDKGRYWGVLAARELSPGRKYRDLYIVQWGPSPSVYKAAGDFTLSYFADGRGVRLTHRIPRHPDQCVGDQRECVYEAMPGDDIVCIQRFNRAHDVALQYREGRRRGGMLFGAPSSPVSYKGKEDKIAVLSSWTREYGPLG
jgi:hypothetical protein